MLWHLFEFVSNPISPIYFPNKYAKSIKSRAPTIIVITLLLLGTKKKSLFFSTRLFISHRVINPWGNCWLHTTNAVIHGQIDFFIYFLFVKVIEKPDSQ